MNETQKVTLKLLGILKGPNIKRNLIYFLIALPFFALVLFLLYFFIARTYFD